LLREIAYCRRVTIPGTIVKVLIASPGDTTEFRDAAETALHEWNGSRAAASGAVLLPRRWEAHAVPMLSGADGQTVINSQLVDDADIVIGIFHLRLGGETPRAVSGTAEELARARDAGKPVHVYFSSMDLPRDYDRGAFEVLEQFKSELRGKGLYDQFNSAAELRDKVQRAVEFDIANIATTPRTMAGAAALRATFRFDREPSSTGRMRNRNERIEIVNSGTASADDAHFTLEATDDLGLPMIHGSTGPFTVAPNGGVWSVPVLRYAATTEAATIAFTWAENGQPKSSSHTLSFR